MMSKTLLYVRVSSKEQEKDGFSLDAQEKLGFDYAKRKGLEIVKTWKVSESAWREERTAFNQMIDYAKRHSEIGHIIFDVTDRMTRNDFDKLKINTLIKEHGKTIHFSRSNKILNREATSEDVFMLDIEVAVAKKMSNDISRKTKMGMQEKAEQGLFPSNAPIGYKNNRITGLIEIDEEKASFIRRMFELRASGSHSLSMLTEQLHREGFRNRKGTRCGKSAIANFLMNPIYRGDVRWKGKIIPGSHSPIVSRQLFDKAQEVREGKARVHVQHKGFAFNNLILCGNCGCKVLGETKKKRYNYYHCTFSKGRHEGKGYIREEKIAELLGESLKAISLDQKIANWLKEALKEEGKSSLELQEKRLDVLKTQHEKINSRLSRLYDAKFDNEITEEVFISKEKEYQTQLLEIKSSMEGLQRNNPRFYEDGCQILELCNRLYPLYVKATYEEKAKLANLTASNYSLLDGNLSPKWKKPFSFIAEGLSRTKWLPGQDSNLRQAR